MNEVYKLVSHKSMHVSAGERKNMRYSSAKVFINIRFVSLLYNCLASELHLILVVMVSVSHYPHLRRFSR